MLEPYSLWFMPAGELAERLSRMIRRLSARYGGPNFPPHVTLLGNITGPRPELLAASARIARELRPFTIRLDKLDAFDQYFRCLLVRAALNQPVRHAHQIACREFRRQREPAYMPHLSLLYGNFTAAEKAGAMAELGPRLDLEFKARSLYLYATRPDPLKWRRVARFGLE